MSKIITIGTSLQNISNGMKYNDKKFEIPRSTNIGMLIKLYDSKDQKFFTSLDANFPNDSENNIRIGVEYWLEGFAVRVGYKLKSGGEELGVLSGLKTGILWKLNKVAIKK